MLVGSRLRGHWLLWIILNARRWGGRVLQGPCVIVLGLVSHCSLAIWKRSGLTALSPPPLLPRRQSDCVCATGSCKCKRPWPKANYNTEDECWQKIYIYTSPGDPVPRQGTLWPPSTTVLLRLHLWIPGACCLHLRGLALLLGLGRRNFVIAHASCQCT